MALDAAAAAIAAFPLGLGLSAYLLGGGGWAWAQPAVSTRDIYIAPGVTVIGSLLVLGAALWRPGARAPEPSTTPADWLVLVFSAALAVGSLMAWGGYVNPTGWLMLALLAAVAVGVATAIGARLRGRARQIAASAAVGALAAGVLGFAAALTMLVWLSRAQLYLPRPGVFVALVSSVGLAVAASVSLAARLRAAGAS